MLNMPSPHPLPSSAHVLAYDHVGIRVSKRDEALDFYRALGFDEAEWLHDEKAVELSSAHGARINLIFNGERQPGAHNVLQDAGVRLPGLTHVAFVVDDLAALQHWLAEREIAVTEGPRRIGPRRTALFIRDPDGNVLEFNQLEKSQGDDDEAV